MDLSFIIKPDFDEEDHVYRVDGIARPSVTEILGCAGLSDNGKAGEWTIDEEVLANAAERGAYVHEAIELDCTGDLDEESCDDEILPYVDAWRDFVDDTGFVPIANELRFYEPRNDYCGTLDLLGYIGDELTLIDLKTGSVGLKPWHKFQLAAYGRPIFERTNKWPNRIMLHLRPELKRKKYRDYHFSATAAQWDFRVFLAARTILTAKCLDSKVA